MLLMISFFALSGHRDIDICGFDSNVNTVNSTRHIHVMLRMNYNPLNLFFLAPQVKIVGCW